MKIKEKNQFGFTLVELLVVLSIVMGVTGFGTASYVNFNERQTLEQAGRTFKNNLRLAQNSALSGEIDTAFCQTPNKALTGWCLSPYADLSGYFIYGGCAAPSDSQATTFKEKTNNLPEGVSVKAYDSSGTELTGVNNRIVFKPSAKDRVGIFNGTLPLDSITYCLSAPGIPLISALRYKIEVTSGGDIQDYGITACPL